MHIIRSVHCPVFSRLWLINKPRAVLANNHDLSLPLGYDLTLAKGWFERLCRMEVEMQGFSVQCAPTQVHADMTAMLVPSHLTLKGHELTLF